MKRKQSYRVRKDARYWQLYCSSVQGDVDAFRQFDRLHFKHQRRKQKHTQWHYLPGSVVAVPWAAKLSRPDRRRMNEAFIP